jgi:hypothetical protein
MLKNPHFTENKNKKEKKVVLNNLINITRVFKQLKYEVLRFQTYFEVVTDRYHGTRIQKAQRITTCVNNVYVKSD